MSTVEILNSQLYPDITNIIFDYNMPRKEDVKLLKFANNEYLMKQFYGYKICEQVRLKYYDVLFRNRRNNIKQHKLYYLVNGLFRSLIFAFRMVEGRRQIGSVCGTDMSIICNRDNTIKAVYDNREIHKDNKIMQKIFKIYLNNIKPVVTRW